MAFNGYNGNGYDKTDMNEGGFRSGGFNRGYFDGDGSNRREGREYSNRTDSFDRRNGGNGGGYRDNDYRDHQQQRRDNGYRDERRYESKANRNIMNVDIDHEAERNALRREYIEDHGRLRPHPPVVCRVLRKPRERRAAHPNQGMERSTRLHLRGEGRRRPLRHRIRRNHPTHQGLGDDARRDHPNVP